MPKDWIGNSKAVWATLGASNHTENEREKNDYYATDGKAAEILLDVESFTPTIWENAVGGGDLADVFIKNGYKVIVNEATIGTMYKKNKNKYFKKLHEAGAEFV